MFNPLARTLLMSLSIALILTLGDRTAQAQSLPQTETNTETPPNRDRSSPLPSVTPSNETPVDESPTDETPIDESPTDRTPADETPSNEKKPTDETQPRRFRRYIGIGGSIGLDGDNTGLSEGGFAILTRNDLNDSLSIRSANLFGSSRTDRTVALTVNLPVRSSSGQVKLIPFVGGGLLISSKSFFDDVIVRGLVAGGIDLPLSRRFTATTSVTVGFTDTANVGVQLGVMYGF
jgi:hypothetical protein